MAKKKKKQMRETLYCPYCKRPGVLRPAAYVYGDNNLDPEKYLYVCSGYPSCDSYIGAHKKSMRPMGTMADSDLRNNRHWAGHGKIMIDRRAVNEYLFLIGEKVLPLNLFEVVDIEDRFPVKRVKELLNEKK